MPQFDPAIWPPQLIWLAITFVILYLLMSRVALPRVSEVLEEREFRIGESLRKAENLKRDAEDAVAEYERMMTDARAKAQAQVLAVREQAAAESAQRHAELGERLAREIAEAETRIHQARAAAVAGIRDVAVQAADAAVERLIGLRVDPGALSAAVDGALGERR